MYHNNGVQEHILHLKDTQNLHNIDSSPHNTGRGNKSKMICKGHVAHTENKKYNIYIIDWSLDHFYCCMIKTGHISAIIPHDEKTTIDSLRSPSLLFSDRAELQPVLLISSGGSGYLSHTDRYYTRCILW